MIKVFELMNNGLFNQILNYAKNQKSKFIHINSDSITFKKNNGTYEVKKSTDPNSDKLEVTLDGDTLATITSVEEFKNLVNKGDTK